MNIFGLPENTQVIILLANFYILNFFYFSDVQRIFEYGNEVDIKLGNSFLSTDQPEDGRINVGSLCMNQTFGAIETEQRWCHGAVGHV